MYCNVIIAQGGSKPGLMKLTTSLSKPFRHLERYAGLMQEVEQHLSDDHPDRGDTQRSISFYKTIAVIEDNPHNRISSNV